MKKSNQAFTLIELLVVIAIVGILSGFVTVSMTSAINAAKDAKIRSDIATISKALLVYSANYNTYPGGTGTTPDIYPCTIGGGSQRCTNLEANLASYMTAIPKTPSGGFYIYSYSGTGPSFTLQATLSSGYSYSYSSTNYFNEASWTCGNVFTDSRNSKNYNTVSIGTQCWMAQNLDYDGGCGSVGWSGSDVGWCGYYNGTQYANEGMLYQWSAAMNGSTTPGAQGSCPVGWHVPTHDEWTTMERSICTSGSCATDFPYDTTTTGARGTNEGTKLVSGGSSGFNALLVGYRSDGGNFAGRSILTFWRTSSFDSLPWVRWFNGGATITRQNWSGAGYAFPVRCVKN